MTADNRSALSLREFIPMIAMMISLIALSIDAMLPVLPQIGSDLNVSGENDQQLIVSALLLGLGIGQIFFGPYSDSVGRKRAIYYGYVLFVLGCILSVTATNFYVMLIGRVLQGIGASSPRIVSVALVRDQYEGREMAQIMSFIMGLFILVPALAPAIGQGIVAISHWRGIFVLFLLLGAIGWIWFARRQPETLAEKDRIPFSLKATWSGAKEAASLRTSLGYTLVIGTVFAGFIGFLSSAQQIFEVLYDITVGFPFYFAALSLVMGVSTLTNAKLVARLGMRRLCYLALAVQISVSAIYFLFALMVGGVPPLWANMAYFSVVFFSIGFLFGNLNTLAMGPLGHIAGIGAAFVGSISTLVSVPLGAVLGLMFNGTVIPLTGGFLVFGALGLLIMRWTESGSDNNQPAS